MTELRTGLEADRAKVCALKAEASAREVGRMPTAEEVAETARDITSFGFLNELGQEFADSELVRGAGRPVPRDAPDVLQGRPHHPDPGTR